MISNKPSTIISPPHFYTQRPKRLSNMARFKLFQKRKSSLYQSTNDAKKPPRLLHYKTLYYLAFRLPIHIPKIILQFHNLSMMKMKVLSKSILKQITLYSAIFSELVILTLKKPTNLFKIELLPPLEITPVIEITIHRPNNPTVKVEVLAPPPKTHDKSTR